MNTPNHDISDAPLGGLLLIVDDEPANLSVLETVLAPHYHLRAATSGEQALRLACMEPAPDLVLLDVVMPGMDGYEVLRRLQADTLTRDIPVLFLTALSDSAHEVAALAQGATDYLHKPIEPSLVLARVRTQLEAKSARDLLREMNARLDKKVTAGVRALEEAQRKVMQSEKLASLGQLAAGVAHELNNPLGFVISNLGTLHHYLEDILAVADLAQQAARRQADLASVEAARKERDFDYARQDAFVLLKESSEGLDRMKKIVLDLKGFSRSGEADWQMTDLHQILDSAINIAWNELKYKCRIDKQYASRLPPVHCLPSQLGQVFINLLVNAAQATPDMGIITLTTEPVGADKVRIHIADTGQGIAPKHLDHIFEPFFTTKPVGVGTGLRLSVSHGIVTRHHGTIDVRSMLGKGTTFTLTLLIQPPESAGTTP